MAERCNVVGVCLHGRCCYARGVYFMLALTAVVLSADGASQLGDALRFEAQGDEPAALNAIDALIQARPTWELPRLEAARLRLKSGQRIDKAEYDADIARSLAPENPRAHYLFALAADDQGHRAEARRALEVALEYRPEYALAQLRLAGLLLSEGDGAGAVKVYRSYLARNAADVGARVQLALALERAGKAAEGEVTLRALAKAPAARPVALRTLAAMLDRQGKVHEAQQVRAALGGQVKKMRELRPSRR